MGYIHSQKLGGSIMIMKYGNILGLDAACPSMHNPQRGIRYSTNLLPYTDVCITTNQMVKNNGDLVMGRGFAKAWAKTIINLPALAGRAIGIHQGNGGHGHAPYGLLPITRKARQQAGCPHDESFGILELPQFSLYAATGAVREDGIPPELHLFQVKYHWADDADLNLVKFSTSMLKDWATARPQRLFALNFPAIGNGRLSPKDVLPIVDTLPDNVHVWQFASEKDPFFPDKLWKTPPSPKLSL